MAVKINVNNDVKNGINFKVNSSGFSKQVLKVVVNVNNTMKVVWLYLMKVSFNSNGGTPISTKDVGYGSTIGTLPIPTKYDNTFLGWWTQLTGGSQIAANTIIYDNITYYAHWIYDWVYTTGSLMAISNRSSGWNPPSTVTYSSTISDIKPYRIQWNIEWKSNGADPMGCSMNVKLKRSDGVWIEFVTFSGPRVKDWVRRSGSVIVNDGNIYTQMSVSRSSAYATCNVNAFLDGWHQKR